MIIDASTSFAAESMGVVGRGEKFVLNLYYGLLKVVLHLWGNDFGDPVPNAPQLSTDCINLVSLVVMIQCPSIF